MKLKGKAVGVDTRRIDVQMLRKFINTTTFSPTALLTNPIIIKISSISLSRPRTFTQSPQTPIHDNSPPTTTTTTPHAKPLFPAPSSQLPSQPQWHVHTPHKAPPSLHRAPQYIQCFTSAPASMYQCRNLQATQTAMSSSIVYVLLSRKYPRLKYTSSRTTARLRLWNGRSGWWCGGILFFSHVVIVFVTPMPSSA